MLRTFVLAASLLACSGLAVAECSDGHTRKDVSAPTGTVIASQAPAAKATSLPADAKQTSGVASQSVTATTKTAKAPATPEGKKPMAVAKSM